MDKKTKGSVAELAVAARLMKDGWKVLFPYGENQRYDLVAEQNGRFLRVQVKYSTPKVGVLRVNCGSSNNWSVKPYSQQEIDVIAAYDAHNGRIYFVPASLINTSQFTLRLEKARNNQVKDTHFAQDFEVLPQFQTQ